MEYLTTAVTGSFTFLLSCCDVRSLETTVVICGFAERGAFSLEPIIVAGECFIIEPKLFSIKIGGEGLAKRLGPLDCSEWKTDACFSATGNKIFFSGTGKNVAGDAVNSGLAWSCIINFWGVFRVWEFSPRDCSQMVSMLSQGMGSISGFTDSSLRISYLREKIKYSKVGEEYNLVEIHSIVSYIGVKL